MDPGTAGGASRPVVRAATELSVREGPRAFAYTRPGSYLTAAFVRTRTSEACFAPAMS